MSASSLYLKAPTRSNQDKSTMYVHNHGMLANDAMKTWQFSALWWVFEGPSQLTPTCKHEKRPDSRVRPFLQL